MKFNNFTLYNRQDKLFLSLKKYKFLKALIMSGIILF